MDREPPATRRQAVPWDEEIPVAITVTDADGVIVRMNARARETFAADGGGALVGRNVLDCHPEAAREKVRALLEQQRPNHSTISKGGATQDHPPAAVVPGRALRRPRGDRGPDPRRAAPLRPRVATSLGVSKPSHQAAHATMAHHGCGGVGGRVAPCWWYGDGQGHRG